MTITKEQIIEILEANKKDLENYNYFRPSYGVSENDFEEVAEAIMRKLNETN